MLSSDQKGYPEKKWCYSRVVSELVKVISRGWQNELNLLDLILGASVAAHRNNELKLFSGSQPKVERGANIPNWYKSMLLPTVCNVRTGAGGQEITLSCLFSIPS